MQTSPVKNNISRIINEPFSENDFLYLQDIFLTPGVHQINVNNVDQARRMIGKMLEALQYYQKAAYLSWHDGVLLHNVVDIVKVLLTDDHLVSADSLTLFFLDHFYFDFLWIEETPDLLASVWYEQFKQHIVDFNFNRSIPIIKVKLKSLK